MVKEKLQLNKEGSALPNINVLSLGFTFLDFIVRNTLKTWNQINGQLCIRNQYSVTVGFGTWKHAGISRIYFFFLGRTLKSSQLQNSTSLKHNVSAIYNFSVPPNLYQYTRVVCL